MCVKDTGEGFHLYWFILILRHEKVLNGSINTLESAQAFSKNGDGYLLV